MSYPRRDRRYPPSPHHAGGRGDPRSSQINDEDSDLELNEQDLEILEDNQDKSIETLAETPRGMIREMPDLRGPRPPSAPASDYPFQTQPPSPADPNSIRVRLDRAAQQNQSVPAPEPFGLHAATEPGDPPLIGERAGAPSGFREEIDASIDGSPQVSGPRLLVIGGNNRGKEYPLKRGDNSIGRGMDNDIVLSDIAVSRKHTLVCYEQSGFIVRDLGSGNGTLLNGDQVHTHPLSDGDQMELGNTLLRFVLPLEDDVAAGAHAAPARHHAPYQPPHAAHDREPSLSRLQQVTQPEVRYTALWHDPRLRRLVIFGSIGLIVLFTILLIIKAFIPDGPDQDKKQASAVGARAPDEAAAEEYLKGTNQYHAKNWEQARTHFMKVLKLAPSFDQAKRYAEQASMEINAKNALARSSNSLEAKDFQTARVELSRIPSTSVYAAEARRLKQKVDDRQLATLLEIAKTLKAADDIDGALAKVKEAREISPTNSEVIKLWTQLNQSDSGRRAPVQKTAPRPSSRRPVASARRPAHRPSYRSPPSHKPSSGQGSGSIRGLSGSKIRQVLSLYKDRQWGQAYRAATELASGQKGRAKRSADNLAEAIRLVGQNWNRAGHVTGTAARVKYYKQAMTNDLKIKRGYHQKALKTLIAKTATEHAANALARRKYPEAYKAFKMAKLYGGRDPLLEKILRTLEDNAMQLFTRGYTMRTSNLSQARRLWQQVLRMVPSTSPAYQKAYTWLNNSAPSYQDEDED